MLCRVTHCAGHVHAHRSDKANCTQQSVPTSCSLQSSARPWNFGVMEVNCKLLCNTSCEVFDSRPYVHTVSFTQKHVGFNLNGTQSG